MLNSHLIMNNYSFKTNLYKNMLNHANLSLSLLNVLVPICVITLVLQHDINTLIHHMIIYMCHNDNIDQIFVSAVS